MRPNAKTRKKSKPIYTAKFIFKARGLTILSKYRRDGLNGAFTGKSVLLNQLKTILLILLPLVERRKYAHFNLLVLKSPLNSKLYFLNKLNFYEPAQRVHQNTTASM